MVMCTSDIWSYDEKYVFSYNLCTQNFYTSTIEVTMTDFAIDYNAKKTAKSITS